MRAALLLAAAGCASVNSEFFCHGDDSACVLDGVQGRCEATGHCSFFDPSCPAGWRYGPHAGDDTDACVGDEGEPPDARPDGDDPDQPPPNDDPEAASSLEDSGSYPFDLRNASASGVSFCGEGGDDVFFRFRIFEPEVIYLDTLGSSTSLALGSFEGGCGFADQERLCAARSCEDGTPGAQLAAALEPGEYCVTVAGQGTGTLRLLRGGRAGLEALESVFYDTCGAPDLTSPSMCEGAPDPGGGDARGEESFFFAACSATSFTAAAGDGGALLYLRRGWAYSDDLACGAGLLEAFLDGPGLYWVFVETTAPECGAGTISFYR